MRVLIVLPPVNAKGDRAVFTQHPIVAAYIAGAMETLGAEIQVIDAAFDGVSRDEVARRAGRFQPDVVLILPYEYRRDFPLKGSRTIAEAIRPECPDVKIGFLNGFESPQYQLLREAVAEGTVDFAILGDSELALIELVKSNFGEDVPAGVVLRMQDGTVQDGGPAQAPHLDDIPFPAWHYFEHRRYRPTPHRYRRLPLLPILASRGCPFLCDFCPQTFYLTQEKSRFRSPASIVEEVLMLVEKEDVKEVEFYDFTFGVKRDEILVLCQSLIDAGSPVVWSCNGRIDLCDEEVLAAMSAAGCHRILFGIESGDQALLDATQKNLDLNLVRERIPLCRKYGIHTIASFIIGLPGETPESIDKTVQFAIDINPTYAQFHVARSTRATMENPRWLEAGRFKQHWEVIEGTFSGHAFVPNAFPDAKALFSKGRQAYRRFYLRPRYIWRLLTSMRDMADFIRLVRGAYVALREVLPINKRTSLAS
jgi:anaerobic magnesium-protoporphyrin IX monomethyl ester cyclase